MGGIFSLSMVNNADIADDHNYEDSDSDSEDNLTNEAQNDYDDDKLCGDSATDSVQLSPATYTIKLTLENVRHIEFNLETYEKASLVFLLFDNIESALENMENLNESVVYRWAQQQIRRNAKKWDEKLIEALCVIQNFEVLKNLSYEKSDLTLRYLPQHTFTALYVNKYRKLLYYLCENLTEEQAQNLMNKVKEDFAAKRLSFKTFDFLENYLLYWESLEYIRPGNLSNLYRILKQLNHIDLREKIMNEVASSSPPSSIPSNPVSGSSSSKTVDDVRSDTLKPSVVNGILDESSLEEFISSNNISNSVEICTDPNRYYIDPENPGICLIINQEKFHVERDPTLKHLLPKSNTPLENRNGTNADRNTLKSTFKSFGYTVIAANNLTHIEIIKKITEITKSIREESSFFVCVMSHGEEGVVYGSNSCKVSVKQIQRIMCEANYKHTQNKPKVLLLQSCQGGEFQVIPENGDELEFDGPAKPPVNADLLTFWSTIPGFRAIRHKEQGSWFIQSICEKINEFADKKHLEEIFTEVTREVSQKQWKKVDIGTVTMLPDRNSRFTKAFYFPARPAQHTNQTYLASYF